MKLKKTLFLAVLAIFYLMTLSAQFNNTNKPKQHSRSVNDSIAGDWSFGVGFNIVVDGGGDLEIPFDDKEYNHCSMPFTLNAEYSMDSQFSFKTVISFNKYKAGKKTDRGVDLVA